MGNAPVTVGVSTEQPSYTAGDIVRGKVYLNVESDEGCQDAKYIQVTFQGTEHSIIYHTTSEVHRDRDNHRRRQPHLRREHSEHTIIEVSYPIVRYNDGNRLRRGQYEYPFHLTLPMHLPSSMVYNEGQSECKIVYDLSAKLVLSEGWMSSLTAPQSHQRLQIAAKLPAPSLLADTAGPIATPIENIPVYSCCCCCRKDKGYVRLLSAINSNIFSPNQYVTMTFQADNQSKTEIKNITLRLFQTVNWHSNGHSKRSSKALAQFSLSGRDFPELEKIRTKRAPSIENAPNDNIPMQSPRRTISLTVPMHSTLDTNDNCRYIEVSHSVSLILKTTGKGCCLTNPEHGYKVRIGQGVEQDNSAEQAIATSSVRPEPSAPMEPATHSASYQSYQHQADQQTHHNQQQQQHEEPLLPQPYQYEIPEAEMVLPADWSAQISEVVEIPIAHATVLDESQGAQPAKW